MSLQGYLNLTIKTFHHVTFLKELDSFFVSLKNLKSVHAQRITKLRPTGRHPDCLINDFSGSCILYPFVVGCLVFHVTHHLC